ADLDPHPLESTGHPDETPGDRHYLANVAGDGDWDQVEPAHAAVGRIEGDPARARNIDFGPGVGRSRTFRPDLILVRVVQIAGDDPRPEPQAARRLDKENCEISAGAPA